MKKLLPLSAVASNLGIKPETLRRKVRAGQIRAYKIGKSWRFPEESIDIFLDSCLKPETPLSEKNSSAPKRPPLALQESAGPSAFRLSVLQQRPGA